MISQRLKMGENAELNSIINSTEGGTLLAFFLYSSLSLPSLEKLEKRPLYPSIVRHPKNLEIDAIVSDGIFCH